MAVLLLSDSDLAAIGGASTFVLAAVAVAQIRHSSRQTAALEGQVQVVREAAEMELEALREQVAASIEQGQAVREAARAQLQPIVFAHAYGGALRGPDEGADLGPGEVGFRYRVANEGTGVALNVRHGVEVGGVEREFGDGMEMRSLRPGEEVPPPGGVTALGFTVVFPEAELPAEWASESRSYWARSENVFGDRFETRNPHDPHQSAVFMRIEELPAP